MKKLNIKAITRVFKKNQKLVIFSAAVVIMLIVQYV
jgi:hypothetical protein